MGFQQALSGLNAASKNLEVIGNNLANANTYGAKESRAEFADMYASAMNGGAANAIGIGVQLAAVSQQFTQGNITTTNNSMDLAINGAGFFEVSDGVNPAYLSRNGQFQVNSDGFIVNNQGMKLMGNVADNAGTIIPGKTVPLQMPTKGIQPTATASASFELNFDAASPVTMPTVGPYTNSIDFNDPSTYNNATAQTVYDAQGKEVSLTYYFQKTTPTAGGNDQWNVYVTANGTQINPAPPANPVPSTTITFAKNGSAPIAGAVPQIDLTNFTTASNPWQVNLSFTGATEFGSPFGVTKLSQDGNAAGKLVGVQIEKNGIVTARYSNGNTQAAGQVVLANVPNPQGLQPMGGNVWARTLSAGQVVEQKPGEGSLGVLQSGALEESNVDMTGELVNMITAQRVYQANAQTIKTEDQVMQTLVNMR